MPRERVEPEGFSKRFPCPFDLLNGKIIPEPGTFFYQGELVKAESRWGTFWQADFSEFTTPGSCQIETDCQISPPFMIADWDCGIQNGQKTLRRSAQVLVARSPDLLCPAHGPVLQEPAKCLGLLDRHLAAVLAISRAGGESLALNFPDKESRAPGFREISPHIHQYKSGNTVVITSGDGRAMVIDDGLCIWEPLTQRIEKHDAIFTSMKAALGIKSIDWIVPTHYHAITPSSFRILRKGKARASSPSIR